MPTLGIDKIIISQDNIKHCLERLADQLRQTYATEDDVVAVVLLEGARRFALDLLAAWGRDVPMCYLRAKSYGDGVQSCGRVEITSLDGPLPDITGRRVLLIDDIYDTGLTLRAVMDRFAPLRPADMKTCILLEKQRPHTSKIPVQPFPIFSSSVTASITPGNSAT